MPLSKGNIIRPSCSKKLCRNLFGTTVDRDQLEKDVQSLMRAQLEEARQKWNFDFQTETPLEGKYKWEKVSHVNVLPPQNLMSCPKEKTCASEKSFSSSPVLLKIHAKVDRSMQASCETGSPKCLKRKQTSIKDFYCSKRRTIPYKSNP